MRAVIIDDEKHIHSTLTTLLERVAAEVSVVGHAYGVAEGLERIDQLSPDLLFLDIRMEDGTGFELLNQLDKPYPYIIFVSAHDEYALKAFKFRALDYLMKPVESTALQEAVSRAAQRYKSGLIKDQLDNLSQLIQTRQTGKKIVLRDAENVRIINVDNILWLSAEGSYTSFHLLKGETLVVSRHLKEYAEMLSSFNFYRLHRSYLVNCNQIVRYDKSEASLILNGGRELPVALRKEQLKEMLAKL
ncbi:MAG: response regulator transcription factor [Roseivirga sp.]|nr:response regulator transcription factor [Roseivirga sp.]